MIRSIQPGTIDSRSHPGRLSVLPTITRSARSANRRGRNWLWDGESGDISPGGGEVWVLSCQSLERPLRFPRKSAAIAQLVERRFRKA